MKLSLTASALLASLMLALPSTQAQSLTPFDAALQAYEQQRYDVAFDALARLADDGHPDAARIALLMAAHGPRLFMQRFELTAARRDRWLDAATRAQTQRLAG
jgi:hypothetical protein